MKVFQIPEISEVVLYIRAKKAEWPGSFADWIANKFWNHYQSCGWKLSSNVAMKDWHAAFNSRWQDLPYEEQRKKLEECRKAELKIPDPKKPTIEDVDKTMNYMDDLLSQFQTGKYDWHDLATPYKWLKSEGLIQFTKQEVDKLVTDAGNNKEYGRYLSVRLLFSKLISEGKTFSKYAHDYAGSKDLARGAATKAV